MTTEELTEGRVLCNAYEANGSESKLARLTDWLLDHAEELLTAAELAATINEQRNLAAVNNLTASMLTDKLEEVAISRDEHKAVALRVIGERDSLRAECEALTERNMRQIEMVELARAERDALNPQAFDDLEDRLAAAQRELTLLRQFVSWYESGSVGDDHVAANLLTELRALWGDARHGGWHEP